jgi:glycosyltransferase involved in cell wall biosynthesis
MHNLINTALKQIKSTEIGFPADSLKREGWPFTDMTDPDKYDKTFQWPKISIVTPSFNQGCYIEQTIRSVLLQNYPNLEYIIIDGGSTDETIDIIKKYEPWITYWVSEKDTGQSHAINKGLAKCTGTIFNWLNSDDWYEPQTFYEVATAFINDPSLEVVSGFENHIGLSGEITLHHGTFLTTRIEETMEFCEVAQPSTFFRLETIKQIGGVPEDLHYIMDGETWVKLLLLRGQNYFYKIEKPLVNFRLHENSKTNSHMAGNNFLIERYSIIADLQKFIGVPKEIITYYLDEIYHCPKVYALNRNWQFNDSIISKRKLRIYFIQKYVMKQFRRKNPKQANYGIKQLIKNKAFDGYLVKSLIKLLLKKAG